MWQEQEERKSGVEKIGHRDWRKYVIAFDLEDLKEGKHVVYLSHDDGEGHGVVLGETFQKYFTNLLLIGGSGNEDWQRLPFLDDSGLNPNCANAEKFREIVGLN